MKFIDLYAGIGGFRYALESLGHECVFSAEKDKYAIETYFQNFPSHNPSFDMDILSNQSKENINKIIPDHDILCGGFPCQTFSVGGKKRGFNEIRGTQFFNILKIIEQKKPKYIFLENVKHIIKHDSGRTFSIIRKKLKDFGYDIGEKPLVMSPESIGVPHRRERAFMMAKKNSKPLKISIPEKKVFKNAINIIKSDSVSKKYLLEKETLFVIDSWNKLIKSLKEKPPVLWLDQMISDEWNNDWQDWKKKYILNMRAFYNKNKRIFDKWLKETKIMEISNVKYRRLEWLSKEYPLNLKNKILTIRQSGLRVSKPVIFPTLVASVEVPIFYDESIKKFRKISHEEMGKLQSFPKKFKRNSNDYQAYKMFGNSVNVNVIKFLAKEFK